MTAAVEISHLREVSFEDVIDVAYGRPVEVPDITYSLLDNRRKQVTDYIEDTGQPAYGFNRGFGSNVHLMVSGADNLRALQENLIRSHASCLGHPAPQEVVRATMFLRAKSLALGHSAVRSVVVRQLVDALNRGFTPVVPSFGSVSASGDLAPLSHIALSLFLGEGEACVGGADAKAQPSTAALESVGMKPLALEMKEGLALNNGVQYSTALCAISAEKILRILKTATVATALSAQVMLGADTPFRRDLHSLRKHRGSQVIADCVFELMKGSPLRESHLDYDIDGEIQDPYNLRCAAQILGPCLELIWRAIDTVAVEANSVTDNPIILKADRNFTKNNRKYRDRYVEIVSGGHFHGMPIAVDAYGLIQSASIIARLSNMRCVRYVDGDRNKGLGADLKWPGKIPPQDRWGDPPSYSDDDLKHQSMQSSMMIPEYASASLTNWIWGQAMPNHLFSLSTDAGQEDHVSMAANVALKAYQIAPRLAEIIAIELAFAAQAAAIRKHAPYIPSRAPDGDGGGVKEWHLIERPEDRQLSSASERVLEVIGQHFETVKSPDRSLSTDLRNLANAIQRGDIVAATEQEADYFKDFWKPSATD